MPGKKPILNDILNIKYRGFTSTEPQALRKDSGTPSGTVAE